MLRTFIIVAASTVLAGPLAAFAQEGQLGTADEAKHADEGGRRCKGG
jgi:hypothetical protein